MTLNLVAIGVLIVAAALYAALVPGRWRGWAVLLGSIVALFWLQAPLAPRFADFLLPSATVALAVAGWWLSRPGQRAFLRPVSPSAAYPASGEPPATRVYVRDDWLTLVVVAGTILLLTLFRYTGDFRLTASRPPSFLFVNLTMVEVGLLFAALALVARRLPQRAVLTGAIVAVVALFVALKWPPATTALAGAWRGWTGQDVALAAPADLAWLGFSYVAFRLIHTLRDRQAGILPDLSLRAYLSYVLFAPALVAGPIDRAERFAGDYTALPGLRGLDAARWGLGLWRIGEGLLKKFVLADLLAGGLSLTPALAGQTASPAALWALLLGYGLRLYLDFGGYTDIAIGLGILFGIRLPENFDRPYTRTSLTAFWQSWHITLSNWARFYVFTPLSRRLLRGQRRLPTAVIVLLGHLATMIVIGLWHGISWTFLIWGVWHAVGLFVHKQWSDRTRRWYRGVQGRPWPRRAWAAAGWALTFVYVMLGWVWFLMPDVGGAVGVFARLLGVR
ncbi:MAG TPA: MBOAT family O-acyltransferase [Promineifilum sp.]|nr:MBOAT family O-acyltransferase [Promineifilum sp.]